MNALRSRCPSSVSAVALAAKVATLVVAVVVATLVGATVRAGQGSTAHAQAPFPALKGVLANSSSMQVSESRIGAEFAERIGVPYDLEGAVILTDACLPDPEVWLDLALVEYGLADRAGEINNDTVVWLVCEDPRYVGYFYSGDNPYADLFDSDLVADAMVADLQVGNYTGAVTSGFDVVARQLAAPGALDAAAAAGGDTAEGAVAGSSSATASTATAADEPSGGRRWLLWLSAVAGVGLFGFAWWRRRSKKRDEEHRAEVGAAAAEAVGPVPGSVHELTTKLADLDSRLVKDSTAAAQLILAYESLGEDEMLEVSRRHQAMVGRLAALHTKVGQVGARVEATKPDEATLEELYAPALAEATELLEYVNALEAEAEHAVMLEDKAPVLVVEARKAIDSMRAQYERDAAGLDLPSAAVAFAFAEGLVDQAESQLTDGQRIRAGRLAEDAKTIAEHAGRLPGEMHGILKTIDDASNVFARLAPYAESSWSDVKGNGSEAEESLDAAVDMFERTVAAQPTEFGRDEAAGYIMSLAAVHGELDRAERLAQSIGQRLAFLRRAEEESAKVLADVEREIDEARRWIADPSVDPTVSEEPVAQLDHAAAMLESAREMSRAPKPDWVAVHRTANEADRAVADALADARAQNEAIVALRRELDSARAAAEASVDRAAKYLSAHRRDVGSAAAAQVSDARVEYQRASDMARRAETLEDDELAAALTAGIGAYVEADGAADAAYERMAGDVAREDEQRRDYVPRPTWMGPVVPVPMDSRPMTIPSWGSRGRS
ncbi:MAG: hypothetical protein ACK2T6_07070, partial [Anaerolineae bacterium]